MTRLAETQIRIGNMNELQGIVGAMRSLAGMRMQEAQRILPGIRRYATSIAEAIANAFPMTYGASQPSLGKHARKALILCMAEHGFVGGFNERLLEALQGALEPDDALFVLGARGTALVRERVREPSWAYPMATRSTAVGAVINHLSGELYRRIAKGEIARVEMIGARYLQGTASGIERRTLLPLDPKLLERPPSSEPPLHYLENAELHEKLIAEYVFALLTEAAVESIASENAARFGAMEAAHGNVSKKLDELQLEARLMRQSEITAELLELVTGAEAIVGTQ